MENARIALFDDDETVRRLLTLLAEASGHEVIVQADSMETAREVVETLEEDVVDVAVVDGNLSRGELDSADGAEIARMLRSRLSEVFIIGNSANKDIEGADVNVTKGDPSKLMDAIRAV